MNADDLRDYLEQDIVPPQLPSAAGPYASYHVYTTKIRNFTTKIRNLYKKNPEVFFASRGFSIALQVLRTFIYPNVHILSDVLPDPPPPEYNFYRGRRIAGPGRPAKKSRN